MNFTAALVLVQVVLFAGANTAWAQNPSRQNDLMLAATSQSTATTESFVSRTKETRRETPGQADKPEPAKPSRRKTPTARGTTTTTTTGNDSAVQPEEVPLPVAVKWYKDMAEKGEKDAQYNLGAVYETGFGVKVDEKEAAKWYTRAAEQGHVLAQIRLGVLYLLGDGIKESSIKGSKWIRSAAKSENEFAVMLKEKVLDFEGGQGFDRKKIYKEVHEALENGDIYAREILIRVLAKMKKKLKNRPKKERFAGKVTGSGAKPGTVENVVPAFLDDKAREKTLSEGDFSSIRRQASEGEAESQYLLGRMYETGQKVEMNKATAVKWFTRAAMQGHRDAQFRLGFALIYGIGTKQDATKGGDWLRKAAEQKHEVARQLIAHFTSPETGAIDYNGSVVFGWQLERAINGNGEAQLAVGYMLEHGWGVYQNASEARQWYAKSRAAGTKGASAQMRQLKVSKVVDEPATTNKPAKARKPMATSGDRKASPTVEQDSNWFDFNISMPSSANLKSLMVPIGLIIIGLVLGMIVFRWMDRMMAASAPNHQTVPPGGKDESLYR